MNTDKDLLTVGQLLEKLAELEEENMDWDVVCNAPDGKLGYVTCLELDEDGDLCIGLDDSEFDRSDGYTVYMLLDELKEYKKNTRVYLAGLGMYMTWEEGLSYDDEYEEVGFDGIAIGQYKEQNHSSGWLAEAEKQKLAEEQSLERFKCNFQRLVLFVMMLLLVYGSVYNVRAIITHSGVMWQNIMWSVTCIFLTIICSLTLYFDFEKK